MLQCKVFWGLRRAGAACSCGAMAEAVNRCGGLKIICTSGVLQRKTFNLAETPGAGLRCPVGPVRDLSSGCFLQIAGVWKTRAC